MRVPHLSPIAYRRITIVAAVLLAIIIVTGAAVRLTKSGLACPVGVSCPESQLQAHGPSSGHATIEHLNRLFTGLVSVAVILAVLGSLLRVPKRRDLIWLSWGLVAGVFVQAILGQLTVAFDLKPQFVMAHFLVSIVLLTDALVLVRRSGQPDGPAHTVVSHRTVVLGRVLVGLATLVLFTGTIVTGAGPHSGGGKHQDVARLDLKVETAARAQRGGLDLPRRGAHDAVVAAPRSRTTRDPPAGDAAARAPRRAGRDRLHPVLQRHPRIPRRCARGRRDRGVEHDVDAPPGDVRAHARALPDEGAADALLAPA